MKFIRTYIMILILCYVLVFFGGWIAFRNFYVALAACALVITVVVSVFCAQEERIERLEKRVKELEEKKETPIGEESGLR